MVGDVEGRLVCDLGGTNIRIALARGTSLSHRWSTPITAHSSFEAALASYLSKMQPGAISEIAIGAAGPIDGKSVQLTNAPWIFETSNISAALGGIDVLCFNDLQPVARSIAALKGDELETLSSGAPGSTAQLAVNVGTGFGAAVLHRNGDELHAAATEAGHMALPAIIASKTPQPNKPDLTIEDLLSGNGVEQLYRHLSSVSHVSMHAQSADTITCPADIFAAVENDAVARQTADAFGFALGVALRDLILAHAAWGGVYLYGSVIKGWIETGQTETLIDGLSAIDAMDDRVSKVPVHRIVRDDAALLGLALM
ncbi:MAG: ROK family protein [Pseudomonadota bacterium]